MKAPLTRPPSRAMLGTFNPAVPTDGSLIVANVLRDQFNGLAEMIAAIQTITSAQVDGVTTLNPGTPATVSASIAAGVLHLSFGIPQGIDGDPGPAGPEGETGPVGPPFANAVVDGVTTLPPGNPAAVGVYFDGTDVHFSFEIPQGEPGEQGPAGGVSQEDLEYAINTQTSSNSNDVQFLTATVNDPPTQWDVQQIADKVDELLQALRR